MERRAGDHRGQRRQHDQHYQPREEYREGLAGRLLPRLCPAPHHHPGGDGQDHRDDERPEPVAGDRRRHLQTTVVDEEQPAEADALPRPRQRTEHGEVPEEDLQQRRNVAEHLDVDGRQQADQPVLRQTRHTQDEAEDGGEENADHRHQQGVEQADDEYPRVGIGLGVVDQVLGDAEAGAVVEETEARLDAAMGEVGLGVIEEEPATADDEDHGDDLEGPGAHLRIVEGESARRALGFGGVLHQ
ncbi:hypothetical protein D9M71_408120 [compost metagenome]